MGSPVIFNGSNAKFLTSTASAANFLNGYATTATAAGTTTLTVSSVKQQYFTGVTTQTVVLPVTSTLVLGQSFIIVNNSTGVVTVNSSGSNLVQSVAAGTIATVTCILTSGTTAASWSVQVTSVGGTLSTFSIPTVTDWVAYTPVFTGFGTPTNVQFFSRRNGDSLEVHGTGAAGTCTAVEARMTVGFNGTSGNVTIDTSKGAATNGQVLGYLASYTANTDQPTVIAPTTNQVYVNFGLKNASNGGTAAQNATVAFANGNGSSISMTFLVPIVGWSANTSFTVGTPSTTAVTAATFYAGPTSGSAASPTFRALQVPTVQQFSSGSGNYTTPVGVLYLKIKMVSGGGGGSGAGTGSPVAGSNGGTTTFGTSLLTCTGGSGGPTGVSDGGAGGTATITAPAYGTAITGQSGDGSYSTALAIYAATTRGGSAPYFGGGGAAPYSTRGAGNTGITNTGGGGSGGNTNTASGNNSGSSGGSGAFIEAIIPNPSSGAIYAYVIGGGGAGGAGGTNGAPGNTGASGKIIVEEYYQ